MHNFKRLQSIAPMVTVSAAMLGGLFWPLEVVHSKPLLALAKVMPTFWGMEGLRALVVLNKGLEAVLLPLAVLVLMTVLLMGIGITLQEKT